MNIVIVGGGIAGLSLLRELNRRGMSAVVLERAHHFDHVGDSISLKSQPMRLLADAGLADRLRAVGADFLEHQMLEADGTLLGRVDMRPFTTHGLPLGLTVHRGDLHDALRTAVPQDSLRMGVRQITVDAHRDGVRLHTDQGNFEADLLVAADGVHSKVREQVFHVTPEPLGVRRHAFLIDRPAEHDAFLNFMGRGASVGMMPVSRTRSTLFVSEQSMPDAPRICEDIQTFKQFLAQFTDARIRRALDTLTSSGQILTLDLHEVSIERWWLQRVVLIGDAAHACSPATGYGGGLAMEDAFVLADELSHARDGGQSVDGALYGFYHRRYGRVETIKMWTHLVEVDSLAPTDDTVARRNSALRAKLSGTEVFDHELAVNTATL